MDHKSAETLTRFMTEVGIIQQLGATIIDRHMPGRLGNIHFGLLAHLSRRDDGGTPQRLAFAFQVPKTSMTHMLRVLEEDGMIAMVPNPEDGRSKIVKITPKGRAQMAQTYAAVMAEYAPVFDQIDFSELEQILPSLAHLRAVLDDARGNFT